MQWNSIKRRWFNSWTLCDKPDFDVTKLSEGIIFFSHCRQIRLHTATMSRSPRQRTMLLKTTWWFLTSRTWIHWTTAPSVSVVCSSPSNMTSRRWRWLCAWCAPWSCRPRISQGRVILTSKSCYCQTKSTNYKPISNGVTSTLVGMKSSHLKVGSYLIM